MGKPIAYLKPLAALGGAVAGAFGFAGAAAGIGVATAGLGLADAFGTACAAKGLDEAALLERLGREVLRARDRFDSSDAERVELVATEAALGAHLAECMPGLDEFTSMAVTAEGLDARTAAFVIDQLAARDAMFAEGAASFVPRVFALAVIAAALKAVQEDAEFRAKMLLEIAKETASGVARVEATSEDTNAMVRFLFERTKQRDVTEESLLALASRIAAKVEDPNQALAELERAIEELIRLREAAARGTNFGDFVDEALRRAAAHNEKGELERGEKALATAYSQLRARDEELKQSKLTVIGSAIEQARLMFDAPGMAHWIVERLTVRSGCAPDMDTLLAEQDVWYRLGERTGSSLNLDVSIHLARRAIIGASSSVERARAENDLAISLRTRGERTGGATGLTLLAEAVAAYRETLTVCTEAAMPAQWAATQNNLGNALRTQGERTGGATGLTLLAEAVAAYREALTIRTETAMPVDWATTQNNLGNALATQGNRTGAAAGLALLADAVVAYGKALTVCTEAAMPAQWAMTQNNLGAVLRIQGERTGGAAGLTLLADAVAAYREALTVRTEGAMPADWATTQNNLGNALLAQGERTTGAAGLILLADAAVAYGNALTVCTEGAMPAQWAMTQNNLGNVLLIQGERMGEAAGLTRLTDAVAAYGEALTVWTPEHFSEYYGIATRNLARTEALIAERRRGR